VFADTVADITSRLLAYPPRIDEFGNDLGSVEVWTGTNQNGTKSSIGGDFCQDWNDNTVGTTAYAGASDAEGTNWTNAVVGGCSEPRHLYCFQIDYANPVTVPTPADGASRLAFLSQAMFDGDDPGIDLSNADDVCAAEAASEGFPGTYKALLSTTTASAISRFDTNGPPWRRTDGVFIVEDAIHLSLATELIAPLVRFADGSEATSAGNFNVRTGSSEVYETAQFNNHNCIDWSTDGASAPSVTSSYGRNQRSMPDVSWWSFGSALCSGAMSIYCLEE
jgi:hypothetical protein